MSVSALVMGRSSRIAGDVSFDEARSRSGLVAWLGVCLLMLAAPFESLTPLISFPGQSLSSLESLLLIVVGAWLAAAVSDGPTLRAGLGRVARTPLSVPWILFLSAMFVASLAGVDRSNAMHMTGRFLLTFLVYLVTVNGVTTVKRMQSVFIAAAVAGVAVAGLAMLEYLSVRPVLELLTAFRPRLSVIGTQVRAGGPFQYPTIASMFLEIVFALVLGLLLLAIDARRERTTRTRSLAVVWGLAALLISEAVTLTFTRSGLITMAASLAILGVLRVWISRFDRGTKVLLAITAVVVVQILMSRSFESLRLRLTTEGLEAWYHAEFSGPPRLDLRTGERVSVPVTVTNTGRSTWDSHGIVPFRLSYHWLLPDRNSIVSWEGVRTEFPSPVAPGSTVEINAQVEAPPEAGEYRLMWDIEQEKRLWFSGEPEAELWTSAAVVSGPPIAGARVPIRPLPRIFGRPGRGVLWRAAIRMLVAYPVLGVGPDNYRLMYGRYAGIPDFDERVHSNNMYLEVLVGGGLVGGLAFAWFCWRAAQRVVRPVFRPSDPRVATMAAAVCAAAVAIAVHGIADSFLGFTGTYIPIAIVLGLAVAGDSLNEADAHRV
jgi:O-Antigen ligase